MGYQHLLLLFEFHVGPSPSITPSPRNPRSTGSMPQTDALANFSAVLLTDVIPSRLTD